MEPFTAADVEEHSTLTVQLQKAKEEKLVISSGNLEAGLNLAPKSIKTSVRYNEGYVGPRTLLRAGKLASSSGGIIVSET